MSLLVLSVVSEQEIVRIIMCNNTAFHCWNLSQEQCNVASLAIGITDLITPVISTSLLFGLLLSLRREAWNSPLKRLSLLLCAFFSVNGLTLASVELYNDLLKGVWCEVFVFVVDYASCNISMYLIAVVALLLIQSGAPIIPGRWKRRLKSKLHLLYTFWPEFIFHSILHALSLSVAAVQNFSDNSTCKSCEHGHYLIAYLSYIILAFTIVSLFINIILLGYFYIHKVL